MHRLYSPAAPPCTLSRLSRTEPALIPPLSPVIRNDAHHPLHRLNSTVVKKAQQRHSRRALPSVEISSEAEEGTLSSAALGLEGTPEVISDRRLQQVVQVSTLHSVPSLSRPWEGRQSVYSSASAFVVEVGGLKLLCSTAGAVEHARKIKVRKVGDAREFEVKVAAVCLDADVALLSCKSEEFWEGLEAVDIQSQLPQLQAVVTVAGFSIGGNSFCITSGVVSRIEVIEYSHSSRSLLGLQVDAALNNGSWGGPIFGSDGLLVGMAHQKSSSQAWLERYDEDDMGGEMGNESGDEDDEEESEDGEDESEWEDDTTESIGYAVPCTLLLHVLQDYLEAREASNAQMGEQRSQGQPSSSSSSRSDGGSSASTSVRASTDEEVVLKGMPYLGVRWQHLESSVLRRSLGMHDRQTGVLITGVDPCGSAASGVTLSQSPSQPNTANQDPPNQSSSSNSIQEGDVLLSFHTGNGVHRIALDGTVALTPENSNRNFIASSQPQGGNTSSEASSSSSSTEVAHNGQLEVLSASLLASQRVLFGYCVSSRHVGDVIGATVLRSGQEQQLSLRLVNISTFITSAFGRRSAPYLILGGLVLLELSMPLLLSKDLAPSSRRHMGQSLPSWAGGHDTGPASALEWGMPLVQDEQVVIATEILAGSSVDETHGTELLSTPCCTGRGGELLPRRLIRIDGEPILNLRDVAHSVVQATTHTPAAAESPPEAENLSKGILRLEFSDGYLMALDTASLKQDTRDALAQHGISEAMPSSLQPSQHSLWPFEEGKGRGRQVMQKRQQRKRLSLRR